MITKLAYKRAVQKTLDVLDRAGIILTPDERLRIEVADFGLGELDRTGIQLLTYVNTERCCAKELVLFPGQTCPEHRHPAVDGQPGKEETFRCRAGTVYLYLEGPVTMDVCCKPPPHPDGAYTVFREIKLTPGQQYTLSEDTLHWFQAGPQGAIVSEFSTRSRDDSDVFTDPRIHRIPVIEN